MPEKTVWRSEAEVSQRLEPFRHLIASGMTDAEVAKRTELTVRIVQRWRLKNSLKRTKRTLARQLETVQAISSFGEVLGDVKHRTLHSAVLGAWQPPAFVVREHLDYDQFLRVLDAACRIAGMSEEEVSKALGLTITSVQQGIAIMQRHRQGAGKCSTCEAPLDPNMKSAFCCSLCERLYVRS